MWRGELALGALVFSSACFVHRLPRGLVDSDPPDAKVPKLSPERVFMVVLGKIAFIPNRKDLLNSSFLIILL